jgi:hypothetical protein
MKQGLLLRMGVMCNRDRSLFRSVVMMVYYSQQVVVLGLFGVFLPLLLTIQMVLALVLWAILLFLGCSLRDSVGIRRLVDVPVGLLVNTLLRIQCLVLQVLVLLLQMV